MVKKGAGMAHAKGCARYENAFFEASHSPPGEWLETDIWHLARPARSDAR
jgi:hypothetical protein